MRLIPSCDQFLVDRSGVVGGIKAQVLWLLCSWLWSTNHQTIKGSSEQLHILTIGPIYDQSERNSCHIAQQATLGATFAAISGVSSDLGASDQGFGEHPIRSLPLPTSCQLVLQL